MSQGPAPGAEARQRGYDLARGLAVFGMVLVNFKFVLGLEGAEGGLLAAVAGLFDGRAAATFVTLAGVGVSLLSRRAREGRNSEALSAQRRLLARRGGFLLVLGLLDTLLWPGDILHLYAFYLLAAACLLTASDAALWGLASLSVAGFAALFFALDYAAGWDFNELRYAAFWTPRGFARQLLFNGYHPVLPWITFLLVGMWLGRRSWKGSDRTRLVTAGVACAALAELASAALMPWAASEGGEEAEWCALFFGTQSMPPAPLYILSGGGSAVAVIGLCLWAAERWASAAWLEPIAMTGQLALSLYVLHVLAGLWPLSALVWAGSAPIEAAVALAALFYLLAVAGACWWLRRAERGPLEALMRRAAG